MNNQDKGMDFEHLNILDEKNSAKRSKFRFDNYISPFWYGSIIDKGAKMENLKNIYESYKSGSISLEDFNEIISDYNDSRPPARSI